MFPSWHTQAFLDLPPAISPTPSPALPLHSTPATLAFFLSLEHTKACAPSQAQL